MQLFYFQGQQLRVLKSRTGSNWFFWLFSPGGKQLNVQIQHLLTAEVVPILSNKMEKVQETISSDPGSAFQPLWTTPPTVLVTKTSHTCNSDHFNTNWNFPLFLVVQSMIIQQSK